MTVAPSRWMHVPLTLQGPRAQLLVDLTPYAPLHVFLAPLPDQVSTWIALARSLYGPQGEPRPQACPVLHLKRTDKATVGLLTSAGFLQGTACCAHCKHQLQCAVDGKTRSFEAVLDQKTQE